MFLCCSKCTDDTEVSRIPAPEYPRCLDFNRSHPSDSSSWSEDDPAGDDAPKDEYEPGLVENQSPTTLSLQRRRNHYELHCGDEYTIILERKSDQDKVSIDVDYGDGRTLKIRKMRPGVLSSWNKENPHFRVEVGDVFTEINGKSGDSKVLLQELLTAKSLKIHVKRGER